MSSELFWAENRIARNPNVNLWRGTKSWLELDELRDLVGSWCFKKSERYGGRTLLVRHCSNNNVNKQWGVKLTSFSHAGSKSTFSVFSKTVHTARYRLVNKVSPRDPRDALCKLKCCLNVVRMNQTDRVSAWGALSATATFYSATGTCLVLYTHRCSNLDYRTASIICPVSHICNAEMSRGYHHQTSLQPTLLMSTEP